MSRECGDNLRIVNVIRGIQETDSSDVGIEPGVDVNVLH